MCRNVNRISSLGAMLVLLGVGVCFAWPELEWKSGIIWPEPPVVTPGLATAPPADAIVLFDGRDMSAWNGGEAWELQDGFGIAKSLVTTKQKFGDCQLHLEFASPPEAHGTGQGRGNNGVYLMGLYELQVLDSYENKTYFDGQCGAIYKQHPPLANVCRPPGEWQTYDIVFTAPRFHDDGTLKSPAVLTAIQNGVLIQNNYELQGATSWDKPPTYAAHALRESLALGYHGDPVRFRNIWIRDLMPAGE